MDDILWRETYENLLAQGIDKYDAEVIATDMLEELDPVDGYDYSAYVEVGEPVDDEVVAEIAKGQASRWEEALNLLGRDFPEEG